MFAAGPASAVPGQSLAAVGSDTAYFMMLGITNGNSHDPGHTGYNNSRHNTNHDIITEVPPTNSPPFPASVTEPADGVYPAMTWDSSSLTSTPPNGGAAGVTALKTDSGRVCGSSRPARRGVMTPANERVHISAGFERRRRRFKS